MTLDELREILEETLETPVTTIRSLSGLTVTETKELLNLALFSYEGRASLEDGTEILWALNRDEEGWELTSQEL